MRQRPSANGRKFRFGSATPSRPSSESRVTGVRTWSYWEQPAHACSIASVGRRPNAWRARLVARALVVNRGEPGAYSGAGVIAASCCQAFALENELDRLQVLRGGAPVQTIYPSRLRPRIWRAPVRKAAEALLASPPEVVVVEVDPWPGVSGLLGRGMSGMVARSEATDVLIAPRRSRVSASPGRCKHHLRAIK